MLFLFGTKKAFKDIMGLDVAPPFFLEVVGYQESDVCGDNE